MVYQADYDKIELQKSSYDIILVTLSPLRDRKTSSNNITKFFQFGLPSQNFWQRHSLTWRVKRVFSFNHLCDILIMLHK